MRTALLTFSFLRGNDLSGRPRIERVIKHLDYYRGIQKRLGFDELWVSDNGGDDPGLDLIRGKVDMLIRHPYIERGKGNDCLPCWRMLYDYKTLIDLGFDKLIVLDDDAYILSRRLMEHVWSINSGWETFWCPRYGFPEGALSILCRDAFPTYLKYTSVSWDSRNNVSQMERMMPYTTVNKGNFNMDRWGEDRAPQEPWMDGYFQCPADIPMVPEPE